VEDLIDLVDGAFWGRNPQEELQWLREHAPVWRDVRNDIWGVATYELVKEASGHPKLFSNAGGIRPDNGPIPMMIDMDDPAHWQRRKLVNRGFTPRRVREQEDGIRRTARTLIDAVGERGECDLVWDLAAWLPLIVIGDALGFAPPDREQLLRWSDDLLCALGADDEAAMAKAMMASAGYHEYASRVIAARRAAPTDDLMSTLVHAEVDGDRLDDEEIVMESLLILIGGDETTRHVISGGVEALLRHPDQLARLRADRALLPTAIEELMRFDSPLQLFERTATEDVEIAGVTVREGQKIAALLGSANHDPAVFADPAALDVGRADNPHITFGAGVHFCIGAPLARVELQASFGALLDRTSRLELGGEPVRRPEFVIRGLAQLPVVLGR
jgi:cytochrome P450 family 142 subfamily A polypeptide 1